MVRAVERAHRPRRVGARAIFATGSWLLSVLGVSSAAHAAGPLGPQGSRIQTSRYTIDLFQGPVLATSRITAMGGAYTAIAEGADGIPFNPAAVSLRTPASTTNADFDLSGGITFPTAITDNDFDNNGDVKYATKNFVWATLGGYYQYGKFGIGAIAAYQNYDLGPPTEPIPLPGSNDVVESFTINLLRLDIVAGYALLNDQLHVGGGIRTATFGTFGATRDLASGEGGQRLLFSSTSLGLEGGILWTPYDLPFRVGGAVRTPSFTGVDVGSRISRNADGDRLIGHVYLPDKIDLPWELEVGTAVQLWERPLNVQWIDEDKVPKEDAERWRLSEGGTTEPHFKGARRMLKARARELERQKVLIATSMLLSGPLKNGVGLESALSQTVDHSGRRVVASLRAGIEVEPIPYWLVLRAGSYMEPTRFDQSRARAHGTGGFMFRLFRWSAFGIFDEHTIFRISTMVDAARDYFSTGISFGTFN